MPCTGAASESLDLNIPPLRRPVTAAVRLPIMNLHFNHIVGCCFVCLCTHAYADSWVLTLGKTERTAGFRPSINDKTPWGDSWGASVLRDDDGLYHMWVSVMANNAGIEYWPANSYVVHATSRKPEGPYTYVADAFPVFAHEVDVKRGPGGKWVAFLTAGTVDGKLGPSSYGPAIEFDENGEPTRDVELGASTEPTVLVVADSPYGPWSEPIVLLNPKTSLL